MGQNNFILQPFKKNAKMLNKLKYSLSKIHFTLAKFEKIDIFRKISLLKTRGSNEPVSLILNIKCLHVYNLLNFPVNASLLPSHKEDQPHLYKSESPLAKHHLCQVQFHLIEYKIKMWKSRWGRTLKYPK